MTQSLPPKITFSPDVIFQAIDDEAVLLDMSSEEYFALNELGRRMWQLLSENGSTDNAIRQLLLEYDVDETTLRQDLSEWISDLAELGLANTGPDNS